MNPLTRPPRLAFPIVLAAFVLLASAYSLVIPLGEAPDEVSHFAYIEWLAAAKPLPPAEGPALGEAHQPPLYYVLGALATFWIARGELPVIANPDFALADPQTPNLLLHTRREAFPYHGTWLAWHLVRLLSVVMGAVTVWATWRIALLSVGDEWLALGAAALVAFLPEFTFIGGMVNNDNLVVMLSALAILQLVRMPQRLWAWREALVLGIILGLAVVTKLSGLVLWLVAGLLMLLWAWERRTWRPAISYIAIGFGSAALIASPWLVYNLIRFGDPLGWSQVLSVTPVRQSAMTFGDWIALLQGLFTSFAGRFGGALQLHLSPGLYLVFGLGLTIALLGWIGYLRDARTGALNAGILASLRLFMIFWALLLAAYIRWTLSILGTDQARQLFPGLPLLAIFLVAGLARWLMARRHVIVTALSLSLAILTLCILSYLNSLYALDPVFARSASTVGDFGGTIRVVDYRIESAQVAPGGALAVQFDWESLKATSIDYWLQLQLVGPQDTAVVKEGVPSAGLKTTDWWKPGEVLRSRHIFPIPKDIAPGTYTLRLGLHPFGRWDWLPVRGGDALELGTIVVTPASQ